MQPNTSYQRAEAEGTATGREIKTKSETETHSSHLLILTNLGGRILPEKVKFASEPHAKVAGKCAPLPYIDIVIWYDIN